MTSPTSGELSQTGSAEIGRHQKQARYREQRQAFWDESSLREGVNESPSYYRRRLMDLYRFLIPPGARVLEIGCGAGDLLASLRPSVGVGIDLSPKTVEKARAKYPTLSFQALDAHDFDLGETFDYIVVSDLINDVWDVQAVLETVAHHSHPATRLIMNFYSRLWELPRSVAEKVGVAKPLLSQNWLIVPDVVNLLGLAGFETIHSSAEILWPFPTPLLAGFCNRYLVKLWPFHWFGLTNLLVARPKPQRLHGREPVVSVIVPARNEEGNIPEIFDRVPDMGGGTELIFVEGHSKDDTYGAIEREMALRSNVHVKLFRQTGRGKGDAVRLGFAQASGDVLMILDADLTVPPEDLPRFYEAWRSGHGDFINGVRLVYPMEERAMRFFNFLGNKFFSLAFSWLLSQSIKDTLCGTKVLSRQHYEVIAANRAYFGEIDPFGDFDLIFGAAKYNLKIVDLPVRYQERIYGETNIQRWSHGMILLKMVALASRRIKFI